MHTCVWRTNKFHPFVGSHDDDMGYDETSSETDKLYVPLFSSSVTHPSLCVSHTFKEQMTNDAMKRNEIESQQKNEIPCVEIFWWTQNMSSNCVDMISR